MKLLLDTHLAFWLVSDRAKLNAAEFEAISNPAHAISVSAVSIWELRIKWDRFHFSGARKGPIHPSNAVSGLRLLEVDILALTPEVAAAELRVPTAHNDPFDQLLLTAAQEGGMRLLTRDAKCALHPLAFVPE